MAFTIHNKLGTSRKSHMHTEKKKHSTGLRNQRGPINMYIYIYVYSISYHVCPIIIPFFFNIKYYIFKYHMFSKIYVINLIFFYAFFKYYIITIYFYMLKIFLHYKLLFCFIILCLQDVF